MINTRIMSMAMELTKTTSGRASDIERLSTVVSLDT